MITGREVTDIFYLCDEFSAEFELIVADILLNIHQSPYFVYLMLMDQTFILINEDIL